MITLDKSSGFKWINSCKVGTLFIFLLTFYIISSVKNYIYDKLSLKTHNP